MNQTPRSVLINILKTVFGLFLFSFGVYLTLHAKVGNAIWDGVAPWDVFCTGLSEKLGVQYGNASIAISVTIVIIDLLLREPIGIGMVLDAILVGKFVDLFNWIGIIPQQSSVAVGVLLMLGGLVVESVSQYFYMSAGLGCGPRDGLFVGLGKRVRKVPIGLVSMAMLLTVVGVGILLGGKFGAGTLVCAFASGPILQVVFKILKFDPRDIVHQDIITSFKVLFGLNKKK